MSLKESKSIIEQTQEALIPVFETAAFQIFDFEMGENATGNFFYNEITIKFKLGYANYKQLEKQIREERLK